jgi:DNA-binding NtrC family response regulator
MIVVIDDDPVIHAILKSILGTMNFTVVCLNNAEDLNKIIHAKNEKTIKAILCDLNLEHTDGYKILMQSKKIAPLLPFILMSAEHESSRGAAYPIQPDAFLEKPFTVDQITSLLSTLGIQTQG